MGKMDILSSIVQFMIDKLKIMWLMEVLTLVTVKSTVTPRLTWYWTCVNLTFTWILAGQCKLEKNGGHIFCSQEEMNVGPTETAKIGRQHNSVSQAPSKSMYSLCLYWIECTYCISRSI